MLCSISWNWTSYYWFLRSFTANRWEMVSLDNSRCSCVDDNWFNWIHGYIESQTFVYVLLWGTRQMADGSSPCPPRCKTSGCRHGTKIWHRCSSQDYYLSERPQLGNHRSFFPNSKADALPAERDRTPLPGSAIANAHRKLKWVLLTGRHHFGGQESRSYNILFSMSSVYKSILLSYPTIKFKPHI
jgi:hypothetical protein